MSETATLWQWLLVGYTLTILLESPVLLVGLSARHSLRRRLFCGVWLTACTYPIVVIVLPAYFDVTTERGMYLLVAETFAPAAECTLFWIVFGEKAFWNTSSMWRDFAAITLANLLSFGVGEGLYRMGYFTS